MPLLVVPLAPVEVGRLTLDEYDALRRCELVMFEDPTHPLAARLRSEGLRVGAFDDEPDARREGWALVAAPDSVRVLELARVGARVTSGVSPSPDDLSAAHGAAGGRRATAALGGAAVVMARLRSEDGCPWDREQTHESLRVHLLEEAYEVLDAIDRGEVGRELEEELGDVLLQVLFHARLAEQDGAFDVAGVAEGLSAKLVHRHPHVFGDVNVKSAGEVVANWEELKRSEKAEAGRERGTFEGIPRALPALLAAYKVQKRAAGQGFAASPEEAREGLDLALDGALTPETAGDALFWLVAMARAAGIDPEGALRGATARFVEGIDPALPPA